MSNNIGWISLHRKLRDKPYHKNPKALACWVECLFRANHTNGEYVLGRKNISLKPGQFIFGRDEFGASIGVSGSTAMFWLENFKLDSQLDIKKTTKGSIATVLNWKSYQQLDIKVDNKKTTKKQQKNTVDNDNNVNNDNKYIATEVAKEIPNLLLDKNKHIQIIGLLAEIKNKTFISVEDQRSFIKRYLRSAVDLKTYELDRVKEVMKYLEENADFKWTLETVGKYIDEDLTKFNKNTQDDMSWIAKKYGNQ